MSKIEKPKYFWKHFFVNNIINSQNNLKKNITSVYNIFYILEDLKWDKF